MKLTSSQKKAVEHTKGPLLIVAGAGTGKTTVLIEKVKRILKTGLALPENILLLTFTEKASREMEERIDKALPLGYFQMSILTFHGFCDKLLREEITHIGLSPDYKLQTTAESLLFLRKHIFDFNLKYFRPIGNPNKFISGLLQHFSRLADEDITPKEYGQWVKKQKPKKNAPKETVLDYEKFVELSHAYKLYSQIKIKENVMDFSDLIMFTLRLLRKRQNILKILQNKFTFVLVDEFQDTNIAQYELIKLLAPKEKIPNLTVVGDDSQSIYKFRGASVSNILQFMDDYKTADRSVLLENFRSSQVILDAAYRSIKHNDPDTLEARLDISKDLTSMVKEGKAGDVAFSLSERVEGEADYVAENIEKLSHRKGASFSDCAILVRANNHATPFIQALSRRGIPHQFLGPGQLFKQREVKDLIAYLHVLNDIADSSSLFRVLSIKIFAIDPVDIARLLSFSKKTNQNLYESLNSTVNSDDHPHLLEHQPNITDASQEAFAKVLIIINNGLGKIKSETAGRILFDFLQDSGLLTRLMEIESQSREREAQNVSKFFDRLKTYESDHEDASIPAVVDYIAMSMELGESPTATNTDWTEIDAVTILTIHSAKGLEFPNVFLVNLIQGRFPTYRRQDQIPLPIDIVKELLPTGDHHAQEERRLFYVAATRAQNRLYLTASKYYGEGKRERKVSAFVGEAIGEKALMTQIMKKTQEKKQLTMFEFERKDTHIEGTNIPKKNSFSFSQLNTYKTCPLRFKYQYVLKIPVQPSAAASFGATIHRVLQEFYKRHIAGDNPTLTDLNTLLDQYWTPVGYTSKIFEEKMKATGQKMLTDFYKQSHNKDLSVRHLEQWFKIKIGPYSIVGKMDRVDDNDGFLEIIDYKTGKPPKNEKAVSKLQLSIYALAASNPALYGERIENIRLTYVYLQTMKSIVIKPEQKMLEKTQNEIITLADNINSGKYDAHVGPWCNFCPFKINCEAWQ